MFKEMIRKKQAISLEDCKDVLVTEKRGVLSVNGNDGYPYGMPMNFLYSEEDNCLYFHGSYKGHRGEALQQNNKVSFCVYDKEGYIKPGEWAYNVRSVILFGKTSIIEDMTKKEAVLREFGRKYTDDTAYIEMEIEKVGKVVTILKLDIEHMSGKLVNES